MHSSSSAATTGRARVVSVMVMSRVLVVARGIAGLLHGRHDIRVVGCVASWNDARQCLTAARPDVILVDGTSTSGLRYIASLRQILPTTVVAFGVPPHSDTIAACAQSGVDAFCDEQCDERRLIATIRASLRGELSLPPKTTALLFRHLATTKSGTRSLTNARLTHREADVLRCLQSGASNKEIARHLGVSVATVKNHVHNILQKLGVRGRAAAIGMLHAAGHLDANGGECQS